MVGCSSAPAADPAADRPSACSDAAVATLSFVPDTGEGAEAYLCFGFDPGLLAGETIGAVTWTPPAAGPFVLHHAKVYAVSTDYPDGPVACNGMPRGAMGIDIWAPGAQQLVLPTDTGLQLPAATRRLVVEAHSVRVGSGTAKAASVTLCGRSRAPVNIAGLIGISVSVPALRPHHMETAQDTCTLLGAVHLFSVWPHMHRIGQEISVRLLDGAAGPRTLADVVPWDFPVQSRYPVAAEASLGSRIQTTCLWNNQGDSYVLPGPLTEDEMCDAVLIAWPASAAHCVSEAP